MNVTCGTYLLFKKSNFLWIANFAENYNVMTLYIEISAGNLT